MIPQFVELGVKALQSPIKSQSFYVHALEIILNCLNYNPEMTMRLLDQIQFTQHFFQLWFNKLDSFIRVHDKKLGILVLCRLLTLQIPFVQQHGAMLVDGMFKLFEGYKDALDEREKEEKMDAGEWDSEEVDDTVDAEDGEEEFLPDEHDDEEEVDMNALIGKAQTYSADAEDDDDDDWVKQ